MSNLDNLPSNNKEAPNKPSFKATLRGEVRQNKSGGVASEVRDVFNTQFSTMMMPAVMRLVYDFLEGALRMMILGKSSGGGATRLGGRHTQYNNAYRGNRSSNNRPSYHRAGGGYTDRQQARTIQSSPYEDIFFGVHQDAEDVLNIMRDVVQEFGWCSVGHLYSIVGISNNHTHHAWGWISVDGVGIARDGGGYFIDLPNPVSNK